MAWNEDRAPHGRLVWLLYLCRDLSDVRFSVGGEYRRQYGGFADQRIAFAVYQLRWLSVDLPYGGDRLIIKYFAYPRSVIGFNEDHTGNRR